MYKTKIKVSRPGGRNLIQRLVYSGHERIHILTYQTVTTPDGLIFHIYSPLEWQRPGGYIFYKSTLEDEMGDNLLIDAQQYCICEDRAYAL